MLSSCTCCGNATLLCRDQLDVHQLGTSGAQDHFKRSFRTKVRLPGCFTLSQLPVLTWPRLSRWSRSVEAVLVALSNHGRALLRGPSSSLTPRDVLVRSIAAWTLPASERSAPKPIIHSARGVTPSC